ncbi:hypothetical protein BJX76DRAFT_316237 [Aspergillus varians]
MIPAPTPQRRLKFRRCRRCKSKVLDDAFAYYGKQFPESYVSPVLDSCCGGRGVWEQLRLFPLMVGKNTKMPAKRI